MLTNNTNLKLIHLILVFSFCSCLSPQSGIPENPVIHAITKILHHCKLIYCVLYILYWCATFSTDPYIHVQTEINNIDVGSHLLNKIITSHALLIFLPRMKNIYIYIYTRYILKKKEFWINQFYTFKLVFFFVHLTRISFKPLKKIPIIYHNWAKSSEVSIKTDMVTVIHVPVSQLHQ